MYLIRNALRCIARSTGRNCLIGILVLVIAVSACIGLSIRRAAENARTGLLEDLSVTATISFDRRAAMQEMTPPSGEEGEPTGEFQREDFWEKMGDASALTLEEYQAYAAASTVADFYYSLTVGMNGTDTLKPVTSEDTDTTTESTAGGGAQAPFGDRNNPMAQVQGAQSDFRLVGYSSETAMTDFAAGTASVTSGTVFAEGTEDYACIITEELAAFNNLSVGDSLVLTNPNQEEETYTLTVTGLYTDTTANETGFSVMGMTSSDPANRIYLSYAALAKLVAASESVSTSQTDDTTGRTFETALSGDLTATYVFADVAAYETFATEVYTLGLEDSYTVSSSDLTAFEASLTPLNTLSNTAGYFLAILLIIGAVILVVFNIFSVRERKYEIGVLTAMGMNKAKVALQFLTEIFVVTLSAVIVGAGIGAVVSVPVANALLEGQVASQQQQLDRVEQNFGRGEPADGASQPDGNRPDGQPGEASLGDRFHNMMTSTDQYITEIQAATDFTVVGQLLLLAVALTLVAGAASMLFILRYEPLRILANRD